MACTSAALLDLAFTDQGWIVFAVMPVFALGGIGTPALQARAARQVDPAFHGQFQGRSQRAAGERRLRARSPVIPRSKR